MRKKLLILGGGEMQVPVIEKCKSLGFYTIVTDMSEQAPGFRFADLSLIMDTNDTSATLNAAKENKVDGILTTSDAPVNTVAYVCHELNLFGLSKKSAEISTNKVLQREILKENDFKTPGYKKIKDSNEINSKTWEMSFPVVVKPVDSSASRGVCKVSVFEELNEAVANALSFSKSGVVVIEEFIEGREYSIESLTQNGITYIIAITEKGVVGNSSYFVEERHIIPADLTQEKSIEIEQYVKQIMVLFNIDNSATHIEIKMTKTGPVLIELGARLGGDFIASDLVPLATGVDMLENVILIALGQPIKINKTKQCFSGIQFLHKDNYHQAVKASLKLNFAEKWEFKQFKDAPLKNSLDRLGYFIVEEENSRKELLRKLNLEVDDENR